MKIPVRYIRCADVGHRLLLELEAIMAGRDLAGDATYDVHVYAIEAIPEVYEYYDVELLRDGLVHCTRVSYDYLSKIAYGVRGHAENLIYTADREHAEHTARGGS